MAEGQEDVVNAPRRLGGALPDRIHPGNRPLSAPERSGLGRTEQHGPLLGPGLPLRRRAYRTLEIYEETYTFTHISTNNPGRA